MNSLLSRRLIVVTGKGGVGKTTVAAALGLVAARTGKRTIVAEVARRGDVASAFDRAGSQPFEEIELAAGLFHISIDPQEALEEYLRDQLPSAAVAEVLIRSRVFAMVAAATPGMRELLTVGKLWELAQLDRRTPGADAYDLVVVDAPATGHGVAVLSAPRTFAAAAGSGPIARQGKIIDAMLSDPEQTAIVAVAKAEELAVSETGALRASLHERMGLPLTRVIANMLDPDRFSPREASLLEPHAAHPAVARALRGHRRALRQRAQLGRLRKLTGQAPAHLQLQPDGLDVERLADELAGQL
ncbi:MAG TPA: ArsA-related P-loop ATPase [Solirubrobacteraceae bacterium]|jgi:anion-transporting  ArsA/GET3 family ATPase|nr:ArsA-related P-loop ATPase [Solirubrobacteraceae bacterium]